MSNNAGPRNPGGAIFGIGIPSSDGEGPLGLRATRSATALAVPVTTPMRAPAARLAEEADAASDGAGLALAGGELAPAD